MKKCFSVGILAACMGLVTAFSFDSLRAEPAAAKINIKTTTGLVQCSLNGQNFTLVQAGDSISRGSVIRTEAGSTADLILPDSGTVLRLMPDSELQFSQADQRPAGEQMVTDTSLKLLKGSVIGSQRKLAIPSHFVIATAKSVATIVGTEYVVNADGAVTVLDGAVSINYNLPGNKGSVQVTIPQGSSFDPATGKVVPTSAQYLQNIIADVNTVKQNAQTFKAGGATIVVKPEGYISPTKGNNGVGNGLDPQPPGNPPINDGPGTSPGNPGNKGGAKN